MWQWFCYPESDRDGDEDNLWVRWYRGLDDAVQGKHDTVLDYLEPRGAHEWREPHTKKLNDDIIEIRIRSNVQHRLFGFFGPERGQFTILLSCTHKQNVYDPPDAKKTAVKRKKDIEDGISNAA